MLVHLHDVGKLNAGFQLKVETPRPEPPWLPAGHVGEGLRLLCAEEAQATRAALGLLDDVLGWGEAVPSLLLAALAHHGRPISEDAGVKTAAIWRPWAGYDPVAAAAAYGAKVRAAYAAAFESGPALPEAPVFQHLFAGLVALADQIGSREADFPLGASKETRAALAERADELLERIGLDIEPLRRRMSDPSPAAMFGWPPGEGPKPMQAATRNAPLDRRLLILEAETGSGKTEAAVLRFRRLFEAGAVDALYFAVPTRAAAAQLQGRVHRAVKALMGAEAVLALPGYLRAGDAKGRALPEYRVEWEDGPEEARLRDARWAAETPRRYLAAPVAVGTVDQAMLAALQAKWAHFRAAALSRALLVIDEVHASDAYMGRVLQRLLRDHLALGGHALLMSATLGAAARRRWLTGGAPPSPEAAEAAPYPALSWAEGGAERIERLGHDGRTKRVAVAAASEIDRPEVVAARALAAARAGARVLVIRNTVALAVETVRALEALDPDPPLLRVNGVRAPHHGRFAAEDRLLLDAAAEAALGREGTAPVVVVGTQTLEQSLDVDADLLLTDLCPVDILLQRIGRLHRHVRPRPTDFQAARCVVLTPERLAPEPALARFGLGPSRDGGGVYEDMAALEATRRLVVERPLWTIPAHNRALVEAATHPDRLDALVEALGEDWRRARNAVVGGRSARSAQAGLNLVDRGRGFEDPDTLFTGEAAVRTRLGEDRATLAFPDGTTGPFGALITRLAVSERLLKGLDWRALEAPEVEAEPEGLRLRLGPVTLRYTRLGVERAEED